MPAKTPEPDILDIMDVTPPGVIDPVTPIGIAEVKQDPRDPIGPEWEPQPGETYAANDMSLRAVIARAKQQKAQGLPEFDPVTQQRVWWRPTGGGRHSPQLRPVADREKALETGRYDYWSPERGTWVRLGVKVETDRDSYRTDNIVEEF